MSTADYAQHFTPLCAVDFVYDLLGELHLLPPYPRLIDPACGEGAFLRRAVERGVTLPNRVFGIERDPRLAQLLAAGTARLCIAVAEALGSLRVPRVTGSFDLVVANPPYGTGMAGLRELTPPAIAQLIQGYALWALPPALRKCPPPQRIRTYPAEALFLELCVALARPGGHVAIILPEGVAANARYATVREWLLGQLQLEAVVGLPRGTFRRTGAAAKTVLFLLTKQRPTPGHRVLLGEVEEWGGDQRGRQALEFVTTVRQADPALRRRLDPGYWHPHYQELLATCPYPLAPLGNFVTDLTYGPIVTGRRAQLLEQRPSQPAEGIAIVNQSQVEFCGVDLTAALRVPQDSPWVSPRSLLKPGDVVLPRSGEGSLNKHRVAVFLEHSPAAVGSFVDLIRLQGLNPFYLAAFLKSRLGRSQVLRVTNGVGVPNISFEEIRSLQIPLLPAEAQQAIERRYCQRVWPWHRQAIARHGLLRKKGQKPSQDAKWQQLRKRGERRWQEVIAQLDQQLAPL
ncbi:MAG: N-6 DNA methylase [Candidatus Zipacnadales bacterium]